MWTYVTQELPALVAAEFPVDMDRQAITGHSMGGHGALTVALRHPDRFRSVSAFAPIVAPSQVPWGQKALGGYLGETRPHGASTTRSRSSKTVRAGPKSSSMSAMRTRSSKRNCGPSYWTEHATRPISR